jgi:hypothetical protein
MALYKIYIIHIESAVAISILNNSAPYTRLQIDMCEGRRATARFLTPSPLPDEAYGWRTGKYKGLPNHVQQNIYTPNHEWQHPSYKCNPSAMHKKNEQHKDNTKYIIQ